MAPWCLRYEPELSQLNEAVNRANKWLKQARNLNFLICIPLVGAACGALLAIFAQKHLGRKGAYLLAYGLLCIPGSILQLFAPNLGAMVVGRFGNCK